MSATYLGELDPDSSEYRIRKTCYGYSRSKNASKKGRGTVEHSLKGKKSEERNCSLFIVVHRCDTMRRAVRSNHLLAVRLIGSNG